jgi:hypothetical protein
MLDDEETEKKLTVINRNLLGINDSIQESLQHIKAKLNTIENLINDHLNHVMNFIYILIGLMILPYILKLFH